MKLINLKKILSSGAMLAIVFSMTACGQNLAQTMAQVSSNQNSSSSSGSGSQTQVDPWAGIETSASSSNIMGQQSFNIDTVNQLLKVSFSLPINIFGTSLHLDIKEIPGSFVAIEPDPVTGKWTLSLNIPLAHLVRGFGLVGPGTLPNGNALPGVPGGEPPRIAAHIVRGSLNFYLYGSVKYFGIFVPTHGFNPYLSLTFPIKNKSNTKVMGYFSTVPAQGGYDGGVFLSVVFPPEVSKILDNLFG